MPLPDWFIRSWDPAIRLLRAVIAFVCHGAAGFVALVVMRFLELVLHWLWPDQGSEMFLGLKANGPFVLGGFPLDFLFQGIDVLIILIVGGFGLYEAIEAYRRPI